MSEPSHICDTNYMMSVFNEINLMMIMVIMIMMMLMMMLMMMIIMMIMMVMKCKMCECQSQASPRVEELVQESGVPGARM